MPWLLPSRLLNERTWIMGAISTLPPARLGGMQLSVITTLL